MTSAPGERESGGNTVPPGDYRRLQTTQLIKLRSVKAGRIVVEQRSFILRSAQQEEALHRIWYALRRWRLVSRRIVLFPTTACSSINRR
ncbi:unnamed protein product [Spirodela intermedia]|uniref:Uncharacterized protein n=1 Tax=Spirodela intermedia TaxID=51605 RepID=A0A7I8L9A4_SPIIN|nr:unnamed protein product [Spirodela intermedia]